jgi:hypothetical protein
MELDVGYGIASRATDRVVLYVLSFALALGGAPRPNAERSPPTAAPERHDRRGERCVVAIDELGREQSRRTCAVPKNSDIVRSAVG